jgi:predicted nucleic acid-binding protein
MKIYLDCCCLQRPFDDKSQPRVAVEAEAILVVLALCESGYLNLISSDALLLEINQIPDQVRKEDALKILNLAKKTVELTSEIETLARKFGAYGIKTLDALHLAFASFSKADYFCTCDDKFLRKAKRLSKLNTKVVSPTELVMELCI